VLVLELGEDECGADYFGGPAGAFGDVLEGGPALGEQGESSFALAAQAAQQRVPGAVVGVEPLVSGRLLTGTWMPIPAPS